MKWKRSTQNYLWRLKRWPLNTARRMRLWNIIHKRLDFKGVFLLISSAILNVWEAKLENWLLESELCKLLDPLVHLVCLSILFSPLKKKRQAELFLESRVTSIVHTVIGRVSWVKWQLLLLLKLHIRQGTNVIHYQGFRKCNINETWNREMDSFCRSLFADATGTSTSKNM